jgi:hypothetical protein
MYARKKQRPLAQSPPLKLINNMPENLEQIKIKQIPETQETPESPEKNQEQVESKERLAEKKTEDKKVNKIEEVKPSVSTKQAVVVSEEEKERIKQIDKILSAGLEDAYLSLSPQLQKEFKIKGEETSQKINKLLNKVRVNIGKIVKLIRNWLLIIPKINPFFLEQEAKIKADKIISLKNKDE